MQTASSKLTRPTDDHPSFEAGVCSEPTFESDSTREVAAVDFLRFPQLNWLGKQRFRAIC